MGIKDLEIKKTFYSNLNERQRRHFAAIEAKQLGHGGISKVSKCFGIHRETIRSGMKELITPSDFPADRIRREGGGRKKNDKRTRTHKSIYRGNRGPHSR